MPHKNELTLPCDPSLLGPQCHLHRTVLYIAVSYA